MHRRCHHSQRRALPLIAKSCIANIADIQSGKAHSGGGIAGVSHRWKSGLKCLGTSPAVMHYQRGSYSSIYAHKQTVCLAPINGHWLITLSRTKPDTGLHLPLPWRTVQCARGELFGLARRLLLRFPTENINMAYNIANISYQRSIFKHTKVINWNIKMWKCENVKFA